MLTLHPASAALADALWIDLLDPTEAELTDVEAATGLRPPSRHEVAEIEATSRLRVAGETLIMSAPLISGAQTPAWETAPTGFALSPNRLVTIRFRPLPAIDSVAGGLAEAPVESGAEVFVRLLEEIVDRAADRLEATADALNVASHAIFHEDEKNEPNLTRRTQKLRDVMTATGRASEHMSLARYALVCIGRMAQFTADRGHDFVAPELGARLMGVKADIASLEQFEENLLSRVQLLQDAANAFISIEQNDVVKVLTIASVVGIPPVLVVGVYGMNFKIIPELSWTYGYPYCLALIVVTTLIPLIWFKVKGWM